MAGTPYTIRLRGSADEVVSSFGRATQAAWSFARALGPGGFVHGSIRAMRETVTSMRFGVTLLGSAFLKFASDASQAWQRVEDQAIRSTLRIHNSVEQLRRDMAFAVGTPGLGPTEAVTGTAAALRAGLRGPASHSAAFLGAEYARLFGLETGAGTAELISLARQAGMTPAEYWGAQNLGRTPRTADYYARASGAAWERARSGFGAPLSHILRGPEATMHRVSAELADTVYGISPMGIWDNAMTLAGRRGVPEHRRGPDRWVADFWRGRPEGRPDPGPAGIGVRRALRGDYTGYFGRPVSEVLAGRGAFDPELGSLRFGLAQAAGADLAAHGQTVLAAMRRRENLGAFGAERLQLSGFDFEGEAARTLRGPLEDLAATAGFTQRQIAAMGTQALTAATSLGSLGSQTFFSGPTGQLQLLRNERAEIIRVQAARGGPEGHEVRRLAQIDAEIASLEAQGRSHVPSATTILAPPPAPFYFSAGAPPGRRTELEAERDEDYRAKGVDLGERVVG